MPDYIIDGAILTGIADAVREKTGTTDPIVPEKMAEMLRNVEGDYERGYAEGYEKGDSNMDGILTRQGTTIRNNRITYLGIEVFRNYESLAVVDFPNVTSTGANIFYACYGLRTVNLPSLISISTNMFAYSSLLKKLDFQALKVSAVALFLAVLAWLL